MRLNFCLSALVQELHDFFPTGPATLPVGLWSILNPVVRLGNLKLQLSGRGLHPAAEEERSGRRWEKRRREKGKAMPRPRPAAHSYWLQASWPHPTARLRATLKVCGAGASRGGGTLQELVQFAAPIHCPQGSGRGPRDCSGHSRGTGTRGRPESAADPRGLGR